MPPLDQGELSFDANSIVDFVQTATLPVLDTLFAGRAVISDFVANELNACVMDWPGARVLQLATEAELQLFEDIRRNNPPLGISEVGAIAVCRLRGARLISNDRQARLAAEELGISVSSSLAVLHYAVQGQAISGEDAVRILSAMILDGTSLAPGLVETFRKDILPR